MMGKKSFLLVCLLISIFSLNCGILASELTDEENIQKETIYVDVTQLFNGTRSSYMQIEGSGLELDFNNNWERHYYLYCDSEYAIVGEMIYGYSNSTNKLYCKTFSSLYTHAAQVQIGSNFYQSSNAEKFHWAQKNVTHSSSHNSYLHVFGIELINPETGVDYYLEIVEN